ncbi:MAG: PEP-CTERM sorting domain-containing protein [Planctomycetales bacterium]|nr:PEP-CTERM sorting domain-containing protein [Planctomycetales bacterium]
MRPTRSKLNNIWKSVLAVMAFPAATVAAPIMPTSYVMPNGQSGAFDYFDQSYDGQGDNALKLSPLSGGLGELTDGVIPSESWNANYLPFVGWLTVNPTISFHFPQVAELDSMTLYFDDTEGQGGVEAPSTVDVTDGTNSVSRPVVDTPDRGQLVVTLDNLGLTGDQFDVTISKGDKWFMLSEVQFDGRYVPEPTGMALLTLGLAALSIVSRK